MSERLSDERLQMVAEFDNEAAAMARELMRSRSRLAALEEGMPALGRALMKAHDDWKCGYAAGAKDATAAGPMMPEVPSDAVIVAAFTHADIPDDATDDEYRSDFKGLWSAIRSALMQEQS